MKNEIEIAWLAGILEGEGSFVPAPPSMGKTSIGVQVSMTDEDVIARVAKMFGTAYHRSDRNPGSWKPAYVTVARGRRAAVIMRAVLPHMGSRRAQRIQALLAGVVYACGKPNGPSLTPELRSEILRAKVAGGSLRSIARSIGVSHQTVWRTIHAVDAA